MERPCHYPPLGLTLLELGDGVIVNLWMKGRSASDGPNGEGERTAFSLSCATIWLTLENLPSKLENQL